MSENINPTNKGFINLIAYAEVFPIVVNTLNLLVEYEHKEKSKDFLFLFKETKDCAINILSSLAMGYNKYNADEKAKCYNYARDSLSHVQSNLLLLEKLNLVSITESDKQITEFETKIRLFGGVIRKMEIQKK